MPALEASWRFHQQDFSRARAKAYGGPGERPTPSRPTRRGRLPVYAEDDPNLSVTISSTTTDKVGDYWDFYVSYPFLRANNADGQMCEDCHAPRVNNDTTSGANGTKVFSHPAGTGVALSRTYDRTVGSNGPIHDANGGGQGTGQADANASNDIRVFASNKVTCLSCHAAHNADSNSVTVDP